MGKFKGKLSEVVEESMVNKVRRTKIRESEKKLSGANEESIHNSLPRTNPGSERGHKGT
ncbi:MAG: hypothetical protein J6Y02_00005 [Pseudobutyrivibrio sp.]|nr:hypothetical protein [Pseudobutyrivibrio sp.]